MTRLEALRPIVNAIGLTFFGEMGILLLWGLWLSPAGSIWPRLLWTATCGVAMGATIATLTIGFVVRRLKSRPALFAAGAIYIGVLTYCTFLCFAIDRNLGLFAAREAPDLFILGGLIPVAVSAPLLVWLAVSEHGARFFDRRLKAG